MIVLGSPNSVHGELSIMALGRLNYCLSVFDPKEHLILCTGGFGAHFNVSTMPHAYYTSEYLVSKGIERTALMNIALSSNTVDDAVKAKEILGDVSYKLEIITSDYHLERVRLIFDTIIPDLDKEYIGISHPDLERNELDNLIKHEKKAIREIKENGLYF